MADGKKIKIDEFREMLRLRTQASEYLIELQEKEISNIGDSLNKEKQNLAVQEIINEKKRMLTEAQSLYVNLLKQGYKVHSKTAQAIKKEIDSLKDGVKETEKTLKTNEKIVKAKEKQVQLQKKLVNLLKRSMNFLMQQDRIIKDTILDLGLAGERANMVRQSFEDSAYYAVRLGGSVKDLHTMMTTFADETGRVKIFTAGMVEDIMQVARGTALGVEQATRLYGQFELMGLSARGTMEYVQGTVETTERMGVNINSVMKQISGNFKKLQTYHFKQGVEGFAQMASYADKMRIDMSQALNAAEVARSLEEAINMTARLQVMGGEFAKADPFEMLHLARTDAAAFQERINQMVTGIATFKRNSKGAFETFISPADRDRIASVADALGMSTEELTIQARRMAEIQRIRQQTLGLGLSKDQREIIEAEAKLDQISGRFIVEIGKMQKDIADITSDDLKVLERNASTLEERAEAARTFEETLKITMQELKLTLLPLLKGVNKFLEFIRPFLQSFTSAVKSIVDFGSQLHEGVGILMGAGSLWLAVAGSLKLSALALKGAAGLMGAKSTTEGIDSSIKRTRRAKGSAGAGAGVGMAAAGVGVGIGAAAGGISLLADAMKELDKDQLEVLQGITTTLGIVSAVGAAAGAAVLIFGKSALFAAPGLILLGKAALMAGAGIGIAAGGIGYMVGNLADLVKESKGAGPAMFQVATGIGAIGVNALAHRRGLNAFSNTLSNMADHASEIKLVGDAFNDITTFLKGSSDNITEIDDLLKSISRFAEKDINVFSDLKNLFNKPLKVEFSDKEVAVVSNVTLAIDGYEFHEQTRTESYVQQKNDSIKQGRGAKRS